MSLRSGFNEPDSGLHGKNESESTRSLSAEAATLTLTSIGKPKYLGFLQLTEDRDTLPSSHQQIFL